MNLQPPSRLSPRSLLVLLTLLSIGLALLALAACGSNASLRDVTPTPTRTPRPTATFTPPPTPTPAWPVTVGCEPDVPYAACARLQERVAQDLVHFVWRGEGGADVRLSSTNAAGATPVGEWTYALAAPFFTLEEGAAAQDLQAAWSGTPTGTVGMRPLLVTSDTLHVLTRLWGTPAATTVRMVQEAALLTETEQAGGWAILPFDRLEPRWRALRVDGVSLLERGVVTYPLQVPLYLVSERRPDALPLLSTDLVPLSNRDEGQMTVVAMTGVTAMTRAFAAWMDAQGTTYAAQDIRDWLAGADFTHISNEVSFMPDCVAQPSGTMSFCSNDRYIELLEYVGADIIELTGNHLVDKGIEPLRHTFDLYRARGWRWYGGGENLADATRPLTLTHGPNRIAFFGCNTIDNPYDWATDDLPGVNTCRSADSSQLDPARIEQMAAQVRQLREQGYQVIITLQYYETESYTPYPQQIADFHTFADMGAAYVQGSQAHQPQTMEFYGDTFIHYGMGNLFFDQNWTEVLPCFINRLVFYDGRLLNVDMRVTTMEAYGRRRPMTEEERTAFLQMMFDLRPR
jgi:hypothetical protein